MGPLTQTRWGQFSQAFPPGGPTASCYSVLSYQWIVSNTGVENATSACSYAAFLASIPWKFQKTSQNQSNVLRTSRFDEPSDVLQYQSQNAHQRPGSAKDQLGRTSRYSSPSKAQRLKIQRTLVCNYGVLPILRRTIQRRLASEFDWLEVI